jgi:FtsP/CotA-like multicopper oxidase with cupredoxin domain
MSVLRFGLPALAAVALLSGQPAASLGPDAPAASPVDRLPVVSINDNRRPAGVLADGTLTLALRARLGVWRPEGAAGPALPIEAFGEGPAPLSIPAPLIRVPEGTEIVATVRNELAATMRVHGLCERGGGACPPVEIPAGEVREVRFVAGRPGTYHYWATTTGMPLQFRAVGDTQLSGAFVVDPSGADPNRDRIFVITDWTNLTLDQLRQIASADDPGVAFLSLNPKFTFLMNGRSWPHTERLTYQLSEHVRWRVLNLSTQPHTMHLHGFYFEVTSLGDGLRDQSLPSGQEPHVVTQLMPAGGTMAMTWMPERVGNWLFHCHIRAHVSPDLRLEAAGGAAHDDHLAGGHGAHDPSTGMAGMILGVTVVGIDDDSLAYVGDSLPKRRMTLEMQAEPNRFGTAPAFGFVLAGGGESTTGAVPVPGPTLVLKRDEPVEITLVNRLPEATAIHWHGMELDSYYDGVHGWSGTGQRVTPLIEPGGSFVVRFTPPRTGTFMYHTHLHDPRQLTSGLYGAMLVTEPNETVDEATDHVFLMGRDGPDPAAPAVLNGQRAAQVVWTAGARHRVRLINITPSDIFAVTLQTSDGPVDWLPLTKDGAPVTGDRREARPAKQIIGAGETYDFTYQAPAGRRTLWLEVRSPAGKWQTQAHIIVK